MAFRPLLSLYLSAYCALQTFIHAYIFVKTVNLLVGGEYEWTKIGSLAIGATILQFVDVLHCLIGLTKGNIYASIVQILGRLAMLEILQHSPESRDLFAAAALVAVYTLVEPCRYPYYGMNALGMEVYPLMWLRYSAFLLLYPAGLTLEAVNMFLAVPYHYEHSRLQLGGYSINLGILLGSFLLFIFPFIAKFLFGHMQKQRRNKLGSSVKKSKRQ